MPDVSLGTEYVKCVKRSYATNAKPHFLPQSSACLLTMTKEPTIPRRSKRIRSRTQNLEVKTQQKLISKGITSSSRRKKAPRSTSVELDSSRKCSRHGA